MRTTTSLASTYASSGFNCGKKGNCSTLTQSMFAVSRCLRQLGVKILNERQVRTRFALEGRCCDFAVVDGSNVALLEVTNIALTHTLPASGIARSYQSKLKATVKKADEQLRNVETFAHVACPYATVHKSPSHMETSSLSKRTRSSRRAPTTSSRTTLYIFWR